MRGFRISQQRKFDDLLEPRTESKGLRTKLSFQNFGILVLPLKSKVNAYVNVGKGKLLIILQDMFIGYYRTVNDQKKTSYLLLMVLKTVE